MYQFIQIDNHFFSIADIIRIRFTATSVLIVLRSVESRLVGEEHTIPFTDSESFEFDSQEPSYAALRAWVSDHSLVLVSQAEAQAYRDEQAAIKEQECQALLADCSVMLEEAGITGYELSGSQRYSYEFSINGRRIWRNVEHEDLHIAVSEYVETATKLKAELNEAISLLNAQQVEGNPATSWALTEIEDNDDHYNPDAPYFEFWYGGKYVAHHCAARNVLPTVKECLRRVQTGEW